MNIWTINHLIQIIKIISRKSQTSQLFNAEHVNCHQWATIHIQEINLIHDAIFYNYITFTITYLHNKKRNINKRIKELRLFLEIGRNQFALETGLTKKTIENIEIEKNDLAAWETCSFTQKRIFVQISIDNTQFFISF